MKEKKIDIDKVKTPEIKKALEIEEMARTIREIEILDLRPDVAPANEVEARIEAETLYNAGYRKESETAKNTLEDFICRIVNARLAHVNDDLYYELLELKDELLNEKYGVEVE
jgi:hypothetical protein